MKPEAIRCPMCGSHAVFSKGFEESLLGTCVQCRCNVEFSPCLAVWFKDDAAPVSVETGGSRARRILRNLSDQGLGYVINQAKRLFTPTSFLFSRAIRKGQNLQEQFYETILNPNTLSESWVQRYLADLNLPAGAKCLDFGCGRGRNISHLSNMGYQVAGQEVYRDNWWKRLGNVQMQIVPTSANLLPWSDESFDLVLTQQILAFFEPDRLSSIGKEFSRVLKPGGHLVMMETNAGSNAVDIHRKYYGRAPYALREVDCIMSNANFKKVDSWYERYYAERFPILRNILFTASHEDIGEWMIVDPRDDSLDPESRGQWVLRMRRP